MPFDGPVLENSTACVYVEARSLAIWLRTKTLSGPPSGWTDFEHKLKVTNCSAFGRRSFFTESLILAQDERWRRA